MQRLFQNSVKVNKNYRDLQWPHCHIVWPKQMSAEIQMWMCIIYYIVDIDTNGTFDFIVLPV